MIKTFDLNKTQLEKAKRLLNGEVVDGCSVEEVSEEMLEVWISDLSGSKDSDDVERAKWYRQMIDEGAELYTFKDGWQDIGEIAVTD